MDYKWRVRQAALAVMVLIGGTQASFAQTAPQPAGSTAQPPSQVADAAADQSAASSQPVVLTQDEAQQSATGNVAELQQMIRDSQVEPLRSTSNGSYDASLLFNGKEMTYYVALSQNKTFWRVIKTSDEARGEAIYRDFALKTRQLSEVEIRRIRLEAQKAFTERMIALAQNHVDRLQADLTIARQQQALVLDQQKETRDQANALQAQKAAAQGQLRDVQRQVRELQRRVEGGLLTQ
ncbi:MAG TPA: DUF2968 domain-containing protein [Paraburkholderia sp.]|jgi:hypothetical protein|nr:DUF2968 domain-containing protein [Paraburkholderia sp.]